MHSGFARRTGINGITGHAEAPPFPANGHKLLANGGKNSRHTAQEPDLLDAPQRPARGRRGRPARGRGAARRGDAGAREDVSWG
jgi:hypothetical protein